MRIRTRCERGVARHEGRRLRPGPRRPWRNRGPRDGGDVGPAADRERDNAESRARQQGENARDRRREDGPRTREGSSTWRVPVDRPRNVAGARLRVALLTYASHVGRSSRLPAQRVQNISATLTCAANTTAAILESHSTIATDQARTGATPRGSSRDRGDISRRRSQGGTISDGRWREKLLRDLCNRWIVTLQGY